jgi:hypothetical protein
VITEFRSPVSQRFLDHWCALRNGARVPLSRDFLDRPEPEFAPIVTLFDVFADDMVIRLQGTAMVSRWGHDKTGLSFFDINPLLPKSEMMRNVWGCLDTPCGLHSQSRFATSNGRAIGVETVSLPLETDPDKPYRLVNTSVFLQELGFDEHTRGLTAMRFRWLDVGGGVPAHPPNEAG